MNDDEVGIPPPIKSLDELMTREEVAKKFGLSERTVDGWRFRGNALSDVKLPSIRFANRVWFWEGGILWWLNHQRNAPDPARIDHMRRLAEGRRVARKRN